MNKHSLQTFFKEEYVNQASYDNLRKIASIADGLKNASRKVMCTVLDKNINENLKILQLANKSAEYCEYLHGDLSGVCVTLAKDFAGTNNLPLLQKKGNFGTRFSPEASAPRYIFAKKADYTDELFIKEDSKILPEQYFEGYKIEPKFYVPTLPLLLINGSEGVSSGFAQKILTRDAKEIKDYLIAKLNGKTPKKFPLPSFNGFDGVVKQGDTPQQFVIEGKIKRLSSNRILITEVPINYDLKSYLDVLDGLEEEKYIQDYKDLSQDSFKFEVRIASKILSSKTDDELLEYLKLTRKISENYTSMTPENKIKEYEAPEEILDDYIALKLEYTEKRRLSKIDDIEKQLTLSSSKYRFITDVINDVIVLNKRKKVDVEKDLANHNYHLIDDSYDYLLKMSISSLTEEELKRLEKSVKDLESAKKKLENQTALEIYLDDLNALKI